MVSILEARAVGTGVAVKATDTTPAVNGPILELVVSIDGAQRLVRVPADVVYQCGQASDPAAALQAWLDAQFPSLPSWAASL